MYKCVYYKNELDYHAKEETKLIDIHKLTSNTVEEISNKLKEMDIEAIKYYGFLATEKGQRIPKSDFVFFKIYTNGKMNGILEVKDESK